MSYVIGDLWICTNKQCRKNVDSGQSWILSNVGPTHDGRYCERVNPDDELCDDCERAVQYKSQLEQERKQQQQQQR
ncbi:hypothetical protein PG993_015223 [Apiospora rasikravindrae]|uniref:Uncharacterized protein n=1 Tax=Apiospora rasikravindrae TaxID=990691 RepID=A0ABR1RQ01_9PEZI